MSRTFAELPGWIFDIEETSAGVFVVAACDARGRSVSRTGTDVDALLHACRIDIKALSPS